MIQISQNQKGILKMNKKKKNCDFKPDQNNNNNKQFNYSHKQNKKDKKQLFIIKKIKYNSMIILK